ncbi:hypothetical protein ATY35_20670 [Vibrio cidicii]|uniref:DUF5655 domain-containing protein n=1 Tax=Vibrio cidicii TaxID=1763883 RepID=A0ABR5W755_9VIBR|nr:hypothetical protein [Vibrio cidicii]KYN90799.1 hypothetical protein ATY35_20670 [Vibrio cidicii]
MSLITQHERFESEVRKHLNTLSSSDLKRLYKLLIAESIFLDKFDCQPAYRGENSHLDFRFILKSDISPNLNYFAVKICEDRMEFYFRKPAMQLLHIEGLRNSFPKLKLIQSDTINEAMILIDNESTLSKVIDLVKNLQLN